MKTLLAKPKYHMRTQTIFISLMLIFFLSQAYTIIASSTNILVPNPPSTPVLDPSDDTGISNSDNITNISNGLTLSGTSDANVTITIYLEGAPTLFTTNADGGGNWTVNIDLTEGIHNITAVAHDGLDDSAPSGILVIVVDTTPPSVPSTPNLDAADDTGVSNSDNITRNTSNLTFTGSSDPNINIQLYNGASPVGSSVTASGAGTWGVDLNLSEGSHNIRATATDVAGNISNSLPLNVIVDTTPPTVIGGGYVPTGIGVATNTSFSLTFNENIGVSATSATGTEDDFRVFRTSGNMLRITVARSSGDVSISGAQATVVNSGAELPDLNEAHYVLVGNKVFTDIAGNDYVGISSTGTWTFTTSQGANITTASGTACATTFTTLGNIIITEISDNNIAGIGGGSRTLVLAITDNDYRFNTAATVIATPAVGGDITTINTPIITSTRITFTVNFQGGNANNDPDVITISGVQVSSGGSVSPATIVKHSSSTLVIQGVTNGVTPFANLTIPTQTVVSGDLDFIVQALPGDPSVDPAQSSFSASSKSVRLTGRAFGSPVEGVFSGNGVALTTGSPNFYTFNPAVVGVNNNIPITFTYTPPGQCPVSIVRTFQVFSSNIAGLSATYCKNGAPSPISVPNAFLDANYPGWSTYRFMYYDPSLGFIEYGPTCSSSSCGTTFDPQSSIHENAINFFGNAIITFIVKNNLNTEIGSYWNQYVFIPIYNPPVNSISISTTSFCEDGNTITLTGNPPPSLTDIFSGPGVNNPTRTFDPKDVPGGSHNNPFNITYTYTDPSTGCSNQSSALVTVFSKPSPPTPSEVHLWNLGATIPAGNPPTTFACQGGSFDWLVSNPTSVIYNWYNDASLNTLLSSNWFFRPDFLNTNIVGTTSFFITRMANGCESPGLEVRATVNQAPTVNAGPSSTTICSTDDLIISTLNPTIGGSASAASSYWVTNGDGEFIDAGSNVIAGPAFFSIATRYRTGVNDKLNQSVFLTLISNDPDGGGPCQPVSDVIFVSITPAPIAVAGSNAIYCADNKIFLSGFVEGANAQTTATWSVLPIGGTIINPTSLTTEFVPSLSQKNNGATLVFSLTTNDPDGPGPCTASADNVTIEINQEATIDAGIDNAFCADETIQLAGVKPIGSGAQTWTWSGGLGSFNDPNTLSPEYNFHPSEIGQSIVFTLTSDDPDGTGPCLSRSDQVSIRIKVAPDPPIIASAFRYCVTPGIPGATEPLSASGPGVRWYNNPGLTGTPSANPFSTGITTLTDSRTTFYATAVQEGCESSATPTTVIVNPAPYPNFDVQNFCLGDGTEFTNTTPLLVYSNGGAGSIISWSYDFGNGIVTPAGTGPLPIGTNSTSGTHENPIHQYANVGLYNPALTAVTSDGCTNSASASSLTGSQIRIGYVPSAAFNYLNICEQDNTQFDYLENLNPAKDDMKTFAWEFDDPTSGANNTSSASDPTHQFNQFGTYNVKLTLVSNLDCIDEVTRPVYILPYLRNSTNFPYITSFEDLNHGWGHEGLALDFRTNSIHDSWNLITPNGSIINSAFDGSKAWVTNNAGFYQNNERSVLYGPCIDLTKLPKPAVSFAYWNNLEQGGDGVYVETSVNNGITWVPLDPIGLRWYNGTSISGLTSQPNVVDNSNSGTIGQALNQYGFTGTTDGWRTGKHSLDAFANQTKLRIRFVFGSNGDNPPGSAFEGFAMDYFKLDSREKIILAENFTNSNETVNNSSFNSFKQSVTDSEVIKIQYHTSLKGHDVLNAENPADPNARVAFYGITTSSSLVPRAYLDGYSEGNYTLPWVDNYYNIRSLEDASFEISSTTENAEPGTIEVSVTIKALLEISETERPVVRIGIVEKTVGTNQYVLRKFLPSAAGYPLAPPNTTISPDQIFQLPNFSWVVDNSNIDQTNLAVIIFIQDQNNNNEGYKQVYQTGIITNPNIIPSIITSLEDPTFAASIQVFPNPANHEVNVVLPQAAGTTVPVVLVDAQGRQVYTGQFNAGEQQKTIITTEMAGGLYVLHVQAPEGSARKKVMVVHEK